MTDAITVNRGSRMATHLRWSTKIIISQTYLITIKISQPQSAHKPDHTDVTQLLAQSYSSRTAQIRLLISFSVAPFLIRSSAYRYTQKWHSLSASRSLPRSSCLSRPRCSSTRMARSTSGGGPSWRFGVLVVCDDRCGVVCWSCVWFLL